MRLIRLHRLDHVAIQVPDVGVAVAWYVRILGLRQVHAKAWGHAPAMMVSEENTGLALFPSGTIAPHIAFGVDPAQFPVVQQQLRELGINFIYQNHGPTESIYFNDPFGQRLEITCNRTPV